MTDTPETLKAALADLTARVAAFEKARVEEEEPPRLTEPELIALCGGGTMPHIKLRAATRLRWCERELARLREGLKAHLGDECDENVDYWVNDPRHRNDKEYGTIRAHSFAKEIQRHRALLKDGGGK